jgi:alpha-1,2-mannosyltransferase
LIANIVHISLNARGGSERLAMSTIKALSSMDMDIELQTLEMPDFALIQHAYGENIQKHIKKIKTLNILNNNNNNYSIHKKCDIVINTHGDMLPFFQGSFTKNNAITYCHFPIAQYLLDCQDYDYASMLENMSLSSMSTDCHDSYYQNISASYRKMMLSSTVLTNSEFSRKAIFRTFGVDSIVLPPPVDVDTFRRASLPSQFRDDLILVVSRFHPSKKIENAICLARLLKQNGVGKRMDIVGNISPINVGYYNYLQHLVKLYSLEDFVRFEVNVKFEKLLDLMQRAKAYVHPLPGEPFGISTVEAMSAGIIPVVPDVGGHTEFVPLKYQFHTFSQGVEAVAAALNAPASERIKISNCTQKYSIANYIIKLQHIIREVLDISCKPTKSMPVISIPKRMPESMRV